MKDQPKPAQEWTQYTDICGVVGDDSVGSQWPKICAAHNAALDAEREKVEQLEGAMHHPDDPNHTCLFKQQLAAEQHYIEHLEACVSNMPKGMGDLTREWLELKEQLAAEREKLETAQQFVRDITDATAFAIDSGFEIDPKRSFSVQVIEQLREQLAVLVDALKEIEEQIPHFDHVLIINGREIWLHDFVNAALAKVKEGK